MDLALNDTYNADSDDEVFMGPVTSKELAKAAKMKRRTQVVIPFINSGIGGNVQKESKPKEKEEGKLYTVQAKLSSLPEESSELSKFEVDRDSLDEQFHGVKLSSVTYFKGKEEIPEENSEDTKKKEENLFRNQHFFEEPRTSELNVTYSFEPEDLTAGTELNKGTHQADKDGGYLSILSEAAIYHASLDSNLQSHQLGDVAGGCTHSQQSLNSNLQSHQLGDVAGDGTHSQQSQDSLEELAQHEKSCESEECTDFQHSQPVFEKLSHLQQPLEERYREFGVSEHDLENQKLTESIMYTSRRESALSGLSPQVGQRNHLHRNKFSEYVNGQAFSSPSVDQSQIQQKVFNFDQVEKSLRSVKCDSVAGSDDVSNCTPSVESIPFLNDRKTEDQNRAAQVDGDVSFNLCSSDGSLKLSDVPEGIGNEDFGIHDVNSSDESKVPNLNCSVNVSGAGTNEISGVWEREDSVEVEGDTFTNEQKDLSAASSLSERLNDTLEEYEMLMRYGVDYILGNKGNSKKTNELYSSLETNVVHNSVEDLPQIVVSSPDSSSSYYEAQTDSQQASSSPLYVSPTTKGMKRGTDLKGATKLPMFEKGKYTKVVVTPKKQGNPLQRVFGENNTPISCRQKSATVLQCSTPSKNVLTKTLSTKCVTGIPLPHMPTTQRFQTPSPQQSQGSCGSFKKPIKPVSTSRIPRGHGSNLPVSARHPRPNFKQLDKIQSPISAYIHNTPSPVLVKNIKAKSTELGSLEKERYVRAVWRTQEPGHVTKPKNTDLENVNPNASCGLPSVLYTRAPCIKVDDKSKAFTMPRVGEKMVKLLDSPCPQVIKHEGRLKVDCRSPQYVAAAQAVHFNQDDSMMSLHAVSGDISVCVSKSASRSNTLGHVSPSIQQKYLK